MGGRGIYVWVFLFGLVLQKGGGGFFFVHSCLFVCVFSEGLLVKKRYILQICYCLKYIRIQSH